MLYGPKRAKKEGYLEVAADYSYNHERI